MEIPQLGIRQCTVCNKLKLISHFYNYSFNVDICDTCVEEVPDYIPDKQIRKYLTKKKKPERQMF